MAYGGDFVPSEQASDDFPHFFSCRCIGNPSFYCIDRVTLFPEILDHGFVITDGLKSRVRDGVKETILLDVIELPIMIIDIFLIRAGVVDDDFDLVIGSVKGFGGNRWFCRGGGLFFFMLFLFDLDARRECGNKSETEKSEE